MALKFLSALDTPVESALLKADADGQIVAASAGTDYSKTINLTVATAAATAAKLTSETVTFEANTLYLVLFTLGNSVSSPTINGKNIRIGTSNASTTTFSIGANSLVPMYYNPTTNVMQITGSYRTGDSTEDYNLRWENSVQAGETITRYKVIMEGVDGKFYPLTIENTTAATKTVSTREFRLGGTILIYNTTTTIAANATFANVWVSEYTSGVIHYTFNQSSGFLAYRPVYLVGTVNANGNFVLDNSTLTSWLTQTLPSDDDGKVYVYLGIMNNTTTAFRIEVVHPIYQYKDGSLRLYSGYSQYSDVSGSAGTATTLATARTLTIGNTGKTFNGSANVSWSLADIGAQAAGSYAAATHTHSDATTSVSGFMSAADKTKLNGVATGANNYSLPEATATVRGGIELFSNTDQSVAANAVSATAGRTYGIQLNSAGQAVVNVPWVDTNTTYSVGNGGLTEINFTSALNTKLAGIATGANNYSHPTGDGNLHVPATSTTNNGKVLTAGSTAGSLSWQSNIAGNAATATKLQTARSIALGGDVSGSANFDGSANITITATVADDSHNHVISNIDGLQTALDGKQAAGSYAAASHTHDDRYFTESESDARYVRADVDTTLTGTVFVDATRGGSISYVDSAGTYVPRPQGASYKTSTDAHTGAITVRLPGYIPSDMMSFWVDVYDYAGNPEGESFSVYVYGYAYRNTSPWWANVGALILSDRTDKSFNVRFGWDGTNHVVCIGETNSTWNYPQVVVRDFQAGYDATSTTFDDNWSIAFLTTLPSIGQTASNNYPVARSAFQLTTARSINGTSFNGTGNITTANWGTARTLTIGNTGKSVNGSANVTWTLSEIGAAPMGIDADIVVLNGETGEPMRLTFSKGVLVDAR